MTITLKTERGQHTVTVNGKESTFSTIGKCLAYIKGVLYATQI